MDKYAHKFLLALAVALVVEHQLDQLEDKEVLEEPEQA